jgi:hypothetical protein
MNKLISLLWSQNKLLIMQNPIRLFLDSFFSLLATSSILAKKKRGFLSKEYLKWKVERE